MQYRVSHQKSNRSQIVLDRSNEGTSHLALGAEQIDLMSNRFIDPSLPRLQTIILPRHDPMPSKHGEKDAYIYQEVHGRGGPRQYVPYRATLERGHHQPHFQQMHRPPARRHSRPRQFQHNQYQQFEQEFFPQPHFPHPRFRNFPPHRRPQHFQENRNNDRNHRGFQERSFSRQRDLQRNAQRDFQPRKNETPSFGSSHSSFVFHNSPNGSPKRSFPKPPTPITKPPTPITPLEKSLRKQKGYSQFYKETSQPDQSGQAEETSEVVAPPEASKNVTVPQESLVDVEHEDSVPIVPLKSEDTISISVPSATQAEVPVLSPIPRNKLSLSRSPKESDSKRSPSFYTASEYSQSFDSFRTATSYGSANGSILDFDNCVDDDQLRRKQWKREFSIRNNSEKLTEVLNVMEQLQNNTPLEEINPEKSESLSPDAVLEKMNKFQDDSTLE